MKQVFQKLTRKKGYNSQHKMCPHCGKFVAESDIKCPYCEGQIGHVRVLKQRATTKSDGNVETTWLLVGICVFYYILHAVKSVDLHSLGIEGLPEKSLFEIYFAPEGLVSLLMGSNFAPFTWGGEFWRLIQYMFLHGGLVHIGFNLYALATLGPMVKNSFGIRRFWVIVILTGIIGGVSSNLGFLIHLNRGPSVGVSGALFGLLGAMYGFFRSSGNFSAAQQFKKFMINANVFCFVISIFMPIDNMAHLGGMFTGIGLGLLMYRLASSKLMIQLEYLALLACSALWFWGIYQMAINLTHMEKALIHYLQ